MEYLDALFGSQGFMPHGHCFLWTPGLLWLSVVSDSLIALAYLTIPITLAYIVRRRNDIPFDWMFGAFGVFILACGGTHLLDIWTMWRPDYWLLGFVKAVTAIASVVTAILLVKLVPKALLIPSQQQLAKVNQELVVASRQAGMAEVATDVLHNVGNVLNSVNVSATLVAERLQGAKASDLAKVAALLKEHEHDLAAFIADDARGKHLQDYLARFSEQLQAEQEAAIAELGLLRGNIDHIKNIVMLQQGYAKRSELQEVVSVVDLLEDGININLDALNRHGVKIIREFDDMPMLKLDRHKVLPIMVNLIANAKHACIASRRADKRMKLKVTSEDGHVKISVSDNGMGIPAENLTRIFNHGFTTRKDGHGFGLHSAALAAKEMGGTLTAHSDGPGKGAIFTLKLPIKTVEDIQ